MQHFYSNSELNSYANEINKDLTEVGEVFMAWMGSKNQSISPNTLLMEKISETPVKFARELLMKNKSKLNRLEMAYGPNDEYFKAFSNNLTKAVLDIISIPISKAEAISQMKTDSSSPEVINLNQQLTEGVAIIQNLKQLKTGPQINTHIIQTERRINAIEKKLNPSSGCFIATFVYGDYNAFEVIKFREFRDNTLATTKLGNSFIKLYYKSSPFLINVLSSFPKSRLVGRRILNIVVKFLK
ncbi:MAG: CFI-box-CTERM domain-containing protein [bacterium]